MQPSICCRRSPPLAPPPAPPPLERQARRRLGLQRGSIEATCEPSAGCTSCKKQQRRPHVLPLRIQAGRTASLPRPAILLC